MTWHYNDLTNASGGVLSAGNPVGYATDADKTQHVAYRGTDSHIHQLSFNGAWHHTDLTRAVQGTPPNSVGDPVAGAWGRTTSVVYRGTDSHIHQLSFNGEWLHTDLTGAAQPNPPNAVADPGAVYRQIVPDDPAVLYRAIDSHLHELSWSDNQWDDADLTVVIEPRNAPPKAAGDATAVYYWPQENGIHVVYRGTNGHLYLLSLHGHAGNQYHGDITSAAVGDAPAAVGNPGGAAWNDPEEQHVVYRANNGRLHELLGTFSGIDAWRHNDLSDAVGVSLNAAGDPAVYAWEVDKTLHVVYSGTDDHIHELAFNDQWRHNDLSDATGAPPNAAGDPSVYACNSDKTLHVVYHGTDNHLHELCLEA
ncbi:hypothetical protein [Streptomyces sp. NRRL B-24484]|uniref:hypothetical protein n=1 Tax=Streptomyces sp. NRRL B-24484 TaxID=1463833 RepID=UPI0004BF96C3|nr:hypothetical protein [Streptomyces sp. NRRL B-24484]